MYVLYCVLYWTSVALSNSPSVARFCTDWVFCSPAALSSRVGALARGLDILHRWAPRGLFFWGWERSTVPLSGAHTSSLTQGGKLHQSINQSIKSHFSQIYDKIIFLLANISHKWLSPPLSKATHFVPSCPLAGVMGLSPSSWPFPWPPSISGLTLDTKGPCSLSWALENRGVLLQRGHHLVTVYSPVLDRVKATLDN